jgi:hypothetical protein
VNVRLVRGEDAMATTVRTCIIVLPAIALLFAPAVGCAVSEVVRGDIAADDRGGEASDEADGEADVEAEAGPDTEPDTEPDTVTDESPDTVADESGADADAEPEAEADGESDEGSCVREEHPAEPVWKAMLLLLDRSVSMTGSAWWDDIVEGVTTFLAETGSTGLVVGLQYFPRTPRGMIPYACSFDAECGAYGPCLPGMSICAGSYAPGTSCMPADYATPAVDFVELPGGESSLLASFAATTATGDATPLQPALEGVLPFVRGAVAAGRAPPASVVVITDGEPTGCTNNTVAGAAVAAAAAHAATPSVPTHVIGLGPVDVALAPLAEAGGTGSVQRINTGTDVATRVAVALRRIRGPRECRYEVPVPSGGPLVPDEVNVELADPLSPGDPTIVPRVVDAAACDAASGGWYFEDVALPGPIVLCPASCAAVISDTLEVTIVLGCPTVWAP